MQSLISVLSMLEKQEREYNSSNYFESLELAKEEIRERKKDATYNDMISNYIVAYNNLTSSYSIIEVLKNEKEF